MAVFQCKMCGAPLDVEQNKTTTTCPYCNMVQTLPRINSKKKQELYERAGCLRLQNEYDNAITIYEQILCEDSLDSEAYWGIVLCRYGIEYVEDPKTKKRVPTINRLQFNSILEDEDYQKALENADIGQKDIYVEEGKNIDEIQKGILQISNSEKPFDIFISYKETDQNGRRTQDSVLAHDLYYQLTEAGFKVFYSRITLEDKLGTAYEPYIFAALNSAKVMVVIGTKEEYFNAVWVKNEWNRYLSLIKKGQKKVLIPAYKDMDPYNLPSEFSHLQAQDMSKLGFMQDLIRGIKKVIGEETKKVEPKENNPSITSLLKRAYIFLEDADFKSADEYANKVLDINPECGEAYYIKFMCDYHIQLKNGKYVYNCRENNYIKWGYDYQIDDDYQIINKIYENSNYQKALRFNFSKIKEIEVKNFITNSIIYQLISLGTGSLIKVYYYFKRNNIQTDDVETRLYECICDKMYENRYEDLSTVDLIYYGEIFEILGSNGDFNEKIIGIIDNCVTKRSVSNTEELYKFMKAVLDANEKRLKDSCNTLDSSQYALVENICNLIKEEKIDSNQELEKMFENLSSNNKNVVELLYIFLSVHKKYEILSEKIYDKAIKELEYESFFSCFLTLVKLIQDGKNIKSAFLKQLLIIKDETEKLSKQNYSKITNLFKELQHLEELINSDPNNNINTKEIIYRIAKQKSKYEKAGDIITKIELLGYLGDYKNSKELRKKEIMKYRRIIVNTIFISAVLAEIILLAILIKWLFASSDVIDSTESLIGFIFYALVAIGLLVLFDIFAIYVPLKADLSVLKTKFHKFK